MLLKQWVYGTHCYRVTGRCTPWVHRPFTGVLNATSPTSFLQKCYRGIVASHHSCAHVIPDISCVLCQSCTNIIWNHCFAWAVLWLRRLIVELSMQRPEFTSGSVCVGSLVYIVFTGIGLSQSSSVSPVNIISPWFPYSYMVGGMNNTPIGVRSSETVSPSYMIIGAHLYLSTRHLGICCSNVFLGLIVSQQFGTLGFHCFFTMGSNNETHCFTKMDYFVAQQLLWRLTCAGFPSTSEVWSSAI
jgi:hypothetical protein